MVNVAIGTGVPDREIYWQKVDHYASIKSSKHESRRLGGEREDRTADDDGDLPDIQSQEFLLRYHIESFQDNARVDDGVIVFWEQLMKQLAHAQTKHAKNIDDMLYLTYEALVAHVKVQRYLALTEEKFTAVSEKQKTW